MYSVCMFRAVCVVSRLARSRRALARGTSHVLDMAAGGAPTLVEQSVTADEAIELISKAKTIVEADMGVKV